MVERVVAKYLVTVVIPTFNRFNYLCLANDLAVTQNRLTRAVVVDYGSSDQNISVEQIYSGQIGGVAKMLIPGLILRY